MDMPQCRNCKHSHAIPEPDAHVPAGWTLCYRNLPYPPHPGQLSAIVEATGKIRTAAIQVVAPDFGCVQFEVRG